MQGDFRLGRWLIQPSLNTISGNAPMTAEGVGASQRAEDLGAPERRLEPKIMQVLVYLSQRPGEVVSKEQLMKAVWPDTFVTDDVLLRCISELRKALEDDAREPRFIQTISKRGYRLIVPVEPAEQARVTSLPDEGTAAAADAVARRDSGRRRWTRARALAAAGLVVAVLAMVIAGAAWLRRRSSSSTQQARIVVAVLPLENLSGDADQEYFSEGLTEEMITQLARLQPQRLAVIARTSAMRYKRTTKTIRQIGAELNAGYVLEGTVRREGSRVRVTSQLVRVGDQAHLWAESYDRELGGILAVQAEIARSIVSMIRLTLETSAAQQLAGARPVDPEAYIAYLKGVHHMHKVSPEGHRLAAQNFEQAVKLDPTYAPAWLGLGNAYRFRGTWWGDMRPREAAPRAKEALARVLQLDPKLGDAYAALGWTRFSFDWDWSGAEADFRRGLELAPNSGGAHSAYGNFLRCMGRLDEARAHMDRSLEIDPLDPLDLADSATLYLELKQPEKAEKLALRALEIDPDFAHAKLWLALVWVDTGRVEKAIELLEKSTAGPQPDLLSLATLAHLYSDHGKKAEARRVFEKLSGCRPPGPPCVRECAFVSATRQRRLICTGRPSRNTTPTWCGSAAAIRGTRSRSSPSTRKSCAA